MARYKKDDKELASVTEIIPSPNLTFWRQKVQRECIVGNCYSEDFEVYMLDDEMLDMVFNAPNVISKRALEDGSDRGIPYLWSDTQGFKRASSKQL
jgi:hypothetical protein